MTHMSSQAAGRGESQQILKVRFRQAELGEGQQGWGPEAFGWKEGQQRCSPEAAEREKDQQSWTAEGSQLCTSFDKTELERLRLSMFCLKRFDLCLHEGQEQLIRICRFWPVLWGVITCAGQQILANIKELPECQVEQVNCKVQGCCLETGLHTALAPAAKMLAIPLYALIAAGGGERERLQCFSQPTSLIAYRRRNKVKGSGSQDNPRLFWKPACDLVVQKMTS